MTASMGSCRVVCQGDCEASWCSSVDHLKQGSAVHISFRAVTTIGDWDYIELQNAYHPQSDGQLELTIQTLKDMLRACALDFSGSWDKRVPLIEFA